MELEQIQDLLKDIPLAEQKSITSLIDIKTNDNMKEVLAAIDNLRSDMDTKFTAIDTKFAAMDTKFTAMDSKFDARFGGVEMRIKTLYWVASAYIFLIYFAFISIIIKNT